MNESTRYAKIVEWSDEDQCFVGSSPGLVYGGCHGSDEKEVFEQLCQIVEEAIALYHHTTVRLKVEQHQLVSGGWSNRSVGIGSQGAC